MIGVIVKLICFDYFFGFNYIFQLSVRLEGTEADQCVLIIGYVMFYQSSLICLFCFIKLVFVLT